MRHQYKVERYVTVEDAYEVRDTENNLIKMIFNVNERERLGILDNREILVGKTISVSYTLPYMVFGIESKVES